MKIRARAPIRIDFAGGWTDVPPFSEQEGGAIINASINRYTYTTRVPRKDNSIRIISADFDTFLEVKDFKLLEYDGNLDLIKAAIKVLNIDQGMDLYVRCDAPPGSGTGSSSSISVALIGMLNRLQKEKLSPHEIAKLGRKLELRELHIAGGKQDYYGSVLGGINYLEFEDPAVSNSPLKVSPDVIAELEKSLVLCYTGKSRLSGNIISTVMNAYKKGEKKTTEALHNLKRIAHDMKSALLTGDLDEFGKLLDENWKNQKQLDDSVTNDNIEKLFDVAYEAGATGGKALGAGGGGCLLFFCDNNSEHKVRRALLDNEAQIIDFNFDFQGLMTWTLPD